MVFEVWLTSEPGLQALHYPVLYPHEGATEASPKTISGITSYNQVRLAFHPYAHLMQRFFNTQRFRPPPYFTKASPWTGIDHLDSGLMMQT